MELRRAFAAIALSAAAACTPEPPQPSKAPASAGACITAADPRLSNAIREDLDSDGKPDWILGQHSAFEIFVDRNGCAEGLGVVPTEGPLAFVHVGAEGEAGVMRDLHVETWLHHGDRAQYVYSWSKDRYVKTKRLSDIIEGRRP